MFSKKIMAKKVKAGTWIEVRWDDVPPEMCLVIDKPDFRGKGDIDVRVYFPNQGTTGGVTHGQIIGISDEPLMLPGDSTFWDSKGVNRKCPEETR